MTTSIISYWKLHKIPLLMVLFSALFYFVFGYELIRSDFSRLILLYAALFFFCFKLIQFEKWNFRFLLVTGVLFRLIFLLAIPCLSQDFYRFIWDGELVLNGINPYLYTPDSIMSNGEIILKNSKVLHEGMGELSARNYSNYPPFNQMIFGLSAYLGSQNILGSVIVMRVFIILADIGVFYFGRKLLKNLNKSPHLIFWYFLNPLVIIELSGNLHFEGVMLLFFAAAMYLLSVSSWKASAFLMAISIQVKLIPLLFLPMFLRYFNWKRALLYYGILALTGLLILLPFYTPEFADHYSSTVRLWFSNFEFNAGFYNGLKQIAKQFDVKAWDLIKIYGKITPVLILAASVYLTFKTKKANLTSLLFSMFWVLCIYYFLSSTVHPWYLVFLVFLCLFSDYRFPILWSALVVLSYSAYGSVGYEENLWLLFIEYSLVFGYMIYEIAKLRRQKLLISKN